jgi:hypothetical protein
MFTIIASTSSDFGLLTERVPKEVTRRINLKLVGNLEKTRCNGRCHATSDCPGICPALVNIEYIVSMLLIALGRDAQFTYGAKLHESCIDAKPLRL